jgi:DNA-binding MarR family transcriptional regulator
MNEEPDYGARRTTVTVRCAEPVRASQLSELAHACRCDLAPDGLGADYLLTDISSVSGQMQEDCSEIADYLDLHGAQALIWIGMDQLDMVFAGLPAEQCHFLIDADDAAAVPILAGANRRGNMDQLHDKSREGDYGALHKISDDLADFARTLARIAEQDGAVPSSLSDRPISFRPAPAAIFEPLIPATPIGHGPKPSKIREIIKLRRMREQHFPADLFADPGWDILLDLYAAKQEGKAVSVSSLCIAAAVPPTTALRWITTMTEHGALVRRQDPNDARRVFIELSEDSEERLQAFFREAEAKGGVII